MPKYYYGLTKTQFKLGMNEWMYPTPTLDVIPYPRRS